MLSIFCRDTWNDVVSQELKEDGDTEEIFVQDQPKLCIIGDVNGQIGRQLQTEEQRSRGVTSKATIEVINAANQETYSAALGKLARRSGSRASYRKALERCSRNEQVVILYLKLRLLKEASLRQFSSGGGHRATISKMIAEHNGFDEDEFSAVFGDRSV